jgi:hypothetical protein
MTIKAILFDIEGTLTMYPCALEGRLFSRQRSRAASTAIASFTAIGEYAMKITVLSDIHGNLAALEAVVDDARSRGVDAFVAHAEHLVVNTHH